MKKNTRPFTLIEILTVIVVIAVIIGVTVPAYNRLMTGNAVSYGNRIVTSQLNMARTHACAKRRNVAVLFTDYNISSYTGEAADEPVALKAFRCAYVNYDAGSTHWEFQEWVEGTKWEYLPNGAFFPTTDASTVDAKDASDGFVSSATVYKVKDEALFSGEADFKLSVIFKKNGRPELKDGTDAPRVQVREGVIVSNDDDNIVTKVNADNKLVAKVNRYTGSVITKFDEE
ncbi:MAG: hypothetical protein MJ106_01690 [Lentisphaeria bacterium]|nr:hypothetical protein [Lentisphaeria bacterium]